MTKKSLLCYAYGRKDDWEAICVDFDIAVQATSFEEVTSFLRKAIELYVEEAVKEDRPTALRLLNRKAPLWLRLRWAAVLFWHWIHRGRDEDDGSYAGFDIPCPA